MDPQSDETKIALLEQAVNNLTSAITDLKSDVREVKDRMDDTYVTKKDFAPILIKVEALWDMRWKIAAIAFIGGILGELVLRFIFKV